jgi:hypothetical protein
MHFLAAESDPMDQVMSKMKIILMFFLCGFLFGGCASGRSAVPKETLNDQFDMAQKVMGGMTGRDVSSDDMKRMARDIQTDPGSRDAAQKILGAGKPVVVKYSPVTGKHYSGELDVDPETGVKLEILPE